MDFFNSSTDVTRSWAGQTDSLIDHFWTNNPQKIIDVSNTVLAVGDHNVITVIIRMKDSYNVRLDSKRRSYKNFDPKLFRQKLGAHNWNEIFDISDVDLANDFLESRVVSILDEMCPYRMVQFRTECKTWLTETTKEKMTTRDNLRELARTTEDPEHWVQYRTLRNEVNRCVNKDRVKHYDDIYKTSS